MPKRTLKKYVKLIEKWKPKLGLSDWTVTASIEDLDTDRDADVERSRDRREAHIRFASHADEKMEVLVVHELVHLHFAYTGGLKAKWEEQSVWALTWALIEGANR